MFAPAIMNPIPVAQQQNYQSAPAVDNQSNLAVAIQNLQQMIVLEQAKQLVAAQNAINAFAQHSQLFSGLAPQVQTAFQPAAPYTASFPQQQWAKVVPVPSIHQRPRSATKTDRVENRRRQPPSLSVRKRKRSEFEDRSHTQLGLQMDTQVGIKLPSVIVLDTNELILNLDRISSLFAFDYFTLVVPVTVINELDHLKMNSRDKSLRIKAQAAISYLYSQTQGTSGLPWIKLQRRDQVFNVPHGGAGMGYEESNDDRIVDCALFQKETLKMDTLLLTEDKNMSLKACCNSLTTMSIDQLFEKLKNTSPKRTKLIN
jgi:hypothetical protein